MTDINYTTEMVATIKAAQPLDLAKAQALGCPTRSLFSLHHC